MLLNTPIRRKRRTNYAPKFRKQLAQRASEPRVSVSLLAQENDINVNMLFKWRRELREGRLYGVMHPQAMLQACRTIPGPMARYPRLQFGITFC